MAEDTTQLLKYRTQKCKAKLDKMRSEKRADKHAPMTMIVCRHEVN